MALLRQPAPYGQSAAQFSTFHSGLLRVDIQNKRKEIQVLNNLVLNKILFLITGVLALIAAIWVVLSPEMYEPVVGGNLYLEVGRSIWDDQIVEVRLRGN